jgi:hypothetical protein
MSLNTVSLIFTKIRKAKRGTLFFTEDFLSAGSYEAIRKVLQRLVKEEELIRISPGIYVRQEVDPVIGPVTPGIEAIAQAIARRDKARIVPTGLYALNRLGLSTQIPLNIVFLTDGSARKIKIGNHTIIFKKSAPKNVAARGTISGLAIQALKTIGKEKVTSDEIAKIEELLRSETPVHLQYDIRLAPEWVRKIFQKARKV